MLDDSHTESPRNPTPPPQTQTHTSNRIFNKQTHVTQQSYYREIKTGWKILPRMFQVVQKSRQIKQKQPVLLKSRKMSRNQTGNNIKTILRDKSSK